MIIGFTGAIGAGKSSAAAALRKIADVPSGNLEYSQPIMAIANEWMERLNATEAVGSQQLEILHRIVADRAVDFPVASFQKMAGSELHEYMAQRRKMRGSEKVVSVDTKAAHRFLLQWLGHQMLTCVDGDFWTKAVHATADKLSRDGAQLITICGVRYDNNAKAIRATGGYMLKIHRPPLGGMKPGYNTEFGISKAYINATIINDGSLENIEQKMLHIWKDIVAHSLKKQY